MKCDICPRHCMADRKTKFGVCGSGITPRIARAALHHWEEPCISGKRGSGTVFFTGCALRCVFCQNHEISAVRPQDKELPGIEADTPELIRIFHDLRDQGAHNINLVTADHYIPEIAKAVKEARYEGFDLPFIFNCSGYETVQSLKMLEGLIDIYLPDFKYAEKTLAKELSNAEDYPDVAAAALSEMVRQRPECIFDEEGMIKKGVIVRNMLLPKHVLNSKKVLKYLHETYGDQIFISIMSQYTPTANVPDEHPELKRKVSKKEYDKLTDYALKLGIENAYIQDLSSSDTGFIPDFQL
ncbi:MAG: radical SAM protein [Lachnospiraceae bacterium]|nr:radical SAM protein [Lachnospiraceae bacterium]